MYACHTRGWLGGRAAGGPGGLPGAAGTAGHHLPLRGKRLGKVFGTRVRATRGLGTYRWGKMPGKCLRTRHPRSGISPRKMSAKTTLLLGGGIENAVLTGVDVQIPQWHM